MLAVPPPGISLCPSPTTQRPPSERTCSTPVTFDGGWPGPMEHSLSQVHSPTSCCSHSCSFCGSAFIAVSFACAKYSRESCLHFERVNLSRPDVDRCLETSISMERHGDVLMRDLPLIADLADTEGCPNPKVHFRAARL